MPMSKMPNALRNVMHNTGGVGTIRAYLRLMRVDKPIGALLLLWPTLWALWLAGNGAPDWKITAIFIAGTFVMRAAGCVVNDIADRRIDPHIARTRHRPLACGELSVRQALLAVGGLLAAALILVLQLNREAQLLSVAAIVIIAVYPFTKRVTHLPQFMLGVAFSWGIPMSYAALRGTLPAEAWLLFAANFAWTVAYDTQYAMVDRNDDLRIGVKSTAILFGRFDNFIVGALHLTCAAVLAVIGWQRDLAWQFAACLCIALAFAAYQQVLCKNRDPEKCLRAFLNNKWFGAAVFVGLVLTVADGH